MVVTSRDRRSNIVVTVIDVEKVMADLEAQLKEAEKWPEGIDSIEPHGMQWAYIETSKGIFLLDNEACGPGGDEKPITDSRKAEWPLYYHKKNTLPMLPDGSVTLSPEIVREFPTKGEMNFGEWVRKFGHRLESNFHNWNKFLEETMGVRPPAKVH